MLNNYAIRVISIKTGNKAIIFREKDGCNKGIK
jgi:hypothetical protein